MSLRVILFVFFLVAGMPYNVIADDAEIGKQLHDKYCVKCHTDSIYNRDDSIIKNFNDLDNRVKRCVLDNEIILFDEEIDAVVSYLNSNFYHFPSN